MAQFLENLKVGDRVITMGGIYGQVTKLGGDSIQLQIADKLRIEVAKASVGSATRDRRPWWSHRMNKHS